MAFVHLIWDMFVYGFGCFVVLVIMGDPKKVSMNILWRSDMIWLRYLGSIFLFFVFLFFFVGGYVCFLVLINLEHPQEVSLKVLWRSDLIWLRYLGSIFLFFCLFIYRFVCFIISIILGYPQGYTPKILWWSDLIWLRYIGSKHVYFLFDCLFVELFVFCFNHSGTSTETSPENFIKIWLDLVEILRIRKLDWKCLFVCLFVCLFIVLFVFVLIIIEPPQEVPLKILWRSDLIWLRY